MKLVSHKVKQEETTEFSESSKIKGYFILLGLKQLFLEAEERTRND